MSVDRRAFDKQLGRRLREARLTLGATQEELAQALGVRAVTVARYELGERSLPIVQLPRMAHVLRIPISSLLPDAEPTPNPPTPPATEVLSPHVAAIARLLNEHPELLPPLLETLEQLLARQRV